HVHYTPEVDVHHALDLLEAQLRDLDELLDDARHVHKSINLTVGLDHLCRKLQNRVTVGHVQHVSRQTTLRRLRELDRLRQSRLTQIRRGHPRAARQQTQHHLAAHAVTATRDHDDLVFDVHCTTPSC